MLRNFRAAIEDWDEVCSALGAWEAHYLTGGGFDSRKDQHKHWVTELLSWGHFVEAATCHPDFPDRSLAGRVEARVRHLQDKLSLWHGSISPVEEERIIETAFH